MFEHIAEDSRRTAIFCESLHPMTSIGREIRDKWCCSRDSLNILFSKLYRVFPILGRLCHREEVEDGVGRSTQDTENTHRVFE